MYYAVSAPRLYCYQAAPASSTPLRPNAPKGVMSTGSVATQLSVAASSTTTLPVMDGCKPQE
jgi:hypothetical protein